LLVTEELVLACVEVLGLAMEPLNRSGEMDIEMFFLTEQSRR